MTTDTDRIRAWADDRNAVPVTPTGAGGPERGPTFVRRDEIGDEHHEHTWEEFAEVLERDDLVFVYHEEEPTGEEIGFFELVEREEAIDRAGLETEEVEDRLLAGETVTTELVETRVIEREIVETDTIESELVDSEVVDRQIVESDVVGREVVETELVDDETLEATVEETRLDTVEEIERFTVESRIVDVEVEGSDELEYDEFESDVADETIHRAILESDVVRESSRTDADRILERGHIKTDREGEVVRSHLVERQTVEEEVIARRRLTFQLTDSEIVETETIGRQVLDSEIVDAAEHPEALAEGSTAGAGVEGEARAGAAGGESETASGAAAGRVELTEDDQGKDVVDANGEQVGIAVDVEGRTMFVDPHPGLTDRLKARFNWGEPDKDSYPVDADEIAEISDDAIVLRSR